MMKRNIHFSIVKTLCLILGVSVSATLAANATTINLSGSAVQIGAPASVNEGDLIAGSIFVFDEQQNRRLPQDLPVDIVPPSDVQTLGDLAVNAMIPQDTCVSSHFLHLEPGSGTAITVTGGAEFDQDILGVAVLTSTLDATNILRHPMTDYPLEADCGLCGMEVGDDQIQVMKRSVKVTFLASTPGDRIRVITACKHQGQ